jgi:hypothetical protein
MGYALRMEVSECNSTTARTSFSLLTSSESQHLFRVLVFLTLFRYFDYITARRNGSVFVRKSRTVSTYPEELKSKVYLFKHFERYIMDRLYGVYAFVDTERTKGVAWVQNYPRMKHVIITVSWSIFIKIDHKIYRVMIAVCPDEFGMVIKVKPRWPARSYVQVIESTCIIEQADIEKSSPSIVHGISLNRRHLT